MLWIEILYKETKAREEKHVKNKHVFDKKKLKIGLRPNWSPTQQKGKAKKSAITLLLVIWGFDFLKEIQVKNSIFFVQKYQEDVWRESGFYRVVHAQCKP